MKNIFKLIFIIFLLINNLFAYNQLDNSSYINTKNITYNEVNETIELGENSLINFNNINILTNRGIIDYKNNKIELFRNLYIYQEESILSASNLVGDINLEKFKANSVSYIYNDDLKIDSNLMERDGNEVYFYDNFMTPCALNGFFKCPTWSLKIPKTLYLVNKDQFIHYNAFLQIADKKVFYLPYFSHYGTKANRQKGFLTPSIDFNLINGATDITTPYYIPLNESSDLEILPKVEFSSSGINQNNIEFKTKFTSKTQGGDVNVYTTNKFKEKNSDNFSSILINSKQTINKKNNFEIRSLYTNSISSSRSENDDELSSYENYLKINSYGVIKENDLLTTEINTVTSFDESNNNLIPYQIPNINYLNQIPISKDSYLYNDLNFYFLERINSDSANPKKNLGLNIDNNLVSHQHYDNTFITNKISISNNFRNLKYSNSELNNNFIQNSVRLSSSFDNFFFENKLNSKLKFVINDDLNSYNHGFNEDSNSVTFNYLNLFKENRFFGSDESDNSIRAIYGFEFENELNQRKLKFNFGQSYDLSKNNRYLEKINQGKNLSDFALNTSLDLTKNIYFDADLRLDNANLAKKELNYSLLFDFPSKMSFEYNETAKDAFSSGSNNSKSLMANLEHPLNDNASITFNTNLDLKNQYSPYESIFGLKLFDECSELFVNYKISRFSDNFNTTPLETISINFKMDYIGFFKYEQESNMFMKKTEN